ncbi:hypothetical protein [Hydrogenobacter hydrogenophilus]|uniref:Uncharacterized protein n=1 Tax=Hydrogenobacter hydrogenophilus TaxID=35835 RepID=A0A285P5W2_9AQUI|nr:hypothetical protein [Hydrogenobacter hydrogenophilus]SNZ15536.1 hypothetical protein SAMN06265353_1395 [Hydrogenobacter hydrogenophilus]
MEVKLKLKKLYGKDRASIEELLQSRAGRNLLPYEIVFNDEVKWEEFMDQIKDYYHKACVIYSNFRYLVKRKTPLPLVKEKISDRDLRRFFEVLRAIN